MMQKNIYKPKDTNEVTLGGFIKEDLKFVTEFHGTKLYETVIGVLRLSGKEDDIPVFISDKMDFFEDLKVGAIVTLEGSLRTSKYSNDGVSKVKVYVQATKILGCSEDIFDDCYLNEITLEGILTKEPILRKSKSNNNIDLAEVVLRAHRGYGRFIHAQCIVWGSDAKSVANLKANDRLRIVGRLQSRYFTRHRKDNSNMLENAINYEVSALRIDILEEG